MKYVLYISIEDIVFVDSGKEITVRPYQEERFKIQIIVDQRDYLVSFIEKDPEYHNLITARITKKL